MTVTVKVSYPYKDLYLTVDNEDAYLVRNHKWAASLDKNTYYARRSTSVSGRKITLRIHRIIMKAKDGQKVDHIDGNGLNCTRSNMRIATNAENNQNNKRPPGASGFRGVSKDRTKYRALISVGNRLIHIGTYNTAEEAAIERDKAAIKYHGSFAVLNFPN